MVDGADFLVLSSVEAAERTEEAFSRNRRIELKLTER